MAAALVLLCLSGRVLALDPQKALHHYVRDNWSVQQGLPQISAVAIAQDVDGYLWVATQSGLARFDGSAFRAHTPATDPGLPDGIITHLLAARDGRLWVGTPTGAAVRDPAGFTALSNADGSGNDAVTGLAEGPDGQVWVATRRGVGPARDGQLHLLPGGPELPSALLARADGLWVGAVGAVHVHASGRWVSQPLPAGNETTRVSHLQEHDGVLWAGTTRGVFAHGQGGWHRMPGTDALDARPVGFMASDRDGNLWVGGTFGVARIVDGKLAELVEGSAANGLQNMTAAYEDREGNLWLGSLSNGLSRLWNGWTRRYTVAQGLSDATVWALAPDPDGRRIWTGTNHGLDVFEDGRFSPVPGSEVLGSPQSLLAEPDRLWIGTRQSLAVIDHSGPRAGVARVPPEFSGIDSMVFGLLRDSRGALWISATSGLYRWDGADLVRFDKQDGLALPVFQIMETTDGRILAASRWGLFELRERRFHDIGAEAGLPPQPTVFAAADLGPGRLAIGTGDGGLHLLQRDRWHSLGADQGVPDNEPFYMQPHAGFLWISGMHGVSRVPLGDLDAFASGRIARVRGEMLLNERGMPNGGQQGLCCNGSGNHDGFLRGDTLWLPTRDGVIALDTTAVVSNPVPPLVHVSSMEADGRWRPAAAMAGIELPPEQRDLAFAFSVLSYQDPRSNGARFRLHGYDADWRTAAPGVRDTRYTNLPPGDYVFEVRGTNNSGVSGAADGTLAFSIRPWFHETWAFRLLLAALALALVYAGHRYQRHLHHQRQARLEGLVRERTAELEASNRQLEQATLTDPLTGLRNRRYVSRQIPADLAYYDRQLDHRGPDEVLVFCLVDVDHFKSVNDRHGHRAGDLVLQQVAQVLMSMVRTGDYVVRWGGEEFLLVFRPMPMRQVAVLGRRVRAAIAGHAFDIGDGVSLSLTASIGLAEYPLFHHDGGNFGWEAMIELADQAMYYVKTHGRDGWAAFRPTGLTSMDTLLGELQDGAEPMVASGRLELIGSVATPA